MYINDLFIVNVGKSYKSRLPKNCKNTKKRSYVVLAGWGHTV